MLVKKYGPLALSVQDFEEFEYADSASIQWNPEGAIITYVNNAILEGEVIE
jgi:hypothetical protein